MCLTVDITRTDPLILSPLGSCEDTGEAGGLEPQWPGGSQDCLEERSILSEGTCKLTLYHSLIVTLYVLLRSISGVLKNIV